MTIPLASERRLLAHEEFDLVRTTHHPDIQALDIEALQNARGDLRRHLEKTSTIARHKRREVRGKSAPRATTASGNAEHAQRRKQVFARALKRTNRQISRLEDEAARERTADGMRRALKLRANRKVHHPSPGRTANLGPVDNPSTVRTMRVNPAKVGSVSQANKAAQARRDS